MIKLVQFAEKSLILLIAVKNTKKYLAVIFLSVLAGVAPVCRAGYEKAKHVSDNGDTSIFHENSQPVSGIIVQDSVPLLSMLTTEYFQAVNTHKNPLEVIDIIKEILKLDPGSVTFWFHLGVQYKSLYEFDPAIDAFEKCLDLHIESAGRPMVQVYVYMGYCYHMLGFYKEESKIYDDGSIHYPDHPALVGRQAICYYAQGKIRDADRLLTEYQVYWEGKGRTDSDIYHNLGILFLETDNLKAERYFRSALNLDPDNIEKQGSLARVLISMGVRMEEAMKLLKEALEIDPDNPILLHMYGWGYFRMEEYTLAKDYLLKAENLYTAYNHNLKLHLDKTEEILSIKLLR